MKRERKIRRVFMPVGKEEITCNVPCDRKLTSMRKDGVLVCDVLLAPIIGQGSVDRGTSNNTKRKCVVDGIQWK